jgi:L-cystine uptake protein TcyP (sodium:dicarboxylate symporter family)
MEQILFLLNTVQESLLQIDVNKYNNFMVLGYFAMWLVFMVYLFLLANRQKNVRDDVKLMAQLLREDEEQDEE